MLDIYFSYEAFIQNSGKTCYLALTIQLTSLTIMRSVYPKKEGFNQ